MKLCDKIIHLRKQQGWSQEELSEYLGVSRQSVSKWESGTSTPELDRIVQLCALFGLTADALIRDDLDLDGSEETAKNGKPLLSLQEAYAYLADHQIAARKIALGNAACVASPAVLIALGGVSDILCTAIGLPVLFLMVAFGVWLFINAGAITGRYRHIEKRKFTPAPGVTAWAREAREQFRPSLIRDVAFGVALCILSPAPIMALSGLFQMFYGYGDVGATIGTGLLMVMVAAGVYLIVRSCTLQNCYQRLLKEKDV